MVIDSYCAEHTVQGIMLDESGENILLVHERGEREPNGKNGKLPGYGLFGGSILLEHQKVWDEKTGLYLPKKDLNYDSIIADSRKQIWHYLIGPTGIENDRLPCEQWDKWNRIKAGAEDYIGSRPNTYPGAGNDYQDMLNYITIVREALEETGLLVLPVRELFYNTVKRSEREHTVVVLKCVIIAGKIDPRSIETDDCRWFPLNALPADLYRSHFLRILKGVPLIVDKAVIKKQGEEVAPWR